MKFRSTKFFDKEYSKITHHNPVLKKKITKHLLQLTQNPNHPSLRLHKLTSSSYWSISIDKSIRVIVKLEKDWITAANVGKHEDVYN